MPLGIERINPRRRPPNPRIVFIKPLDGPDRDIAQDFLERVAAIVVPIMRDNHLNVMSLEEFPPNMEFWGRNFNAGECIQLVLKHPRTHMWLSFEQVQYTMIHELAHILQMNHSRAFWAVRNKFALELQELHLKSYTGEGFWSAGRSLNSNQPFLHSRPLAENELPQSLCGGTYRSRRKLQPQSAAPKRKITYAERQQRRKERKFGKGEGEKLGADDTQRTLLEGKMGKKVSAPAPKIASSKRSRELRAAAALKRFETKKEDEEKAKTEDEDSPASDWDEDAWEYDQEDEKEAVDVGGGKRLVPVSAKDDAGDEEERNLELLELRGCATVGGYGGGVFKDQGDSRSKDAIPSSNIPDKERDERKANLDRFLTKVDKKPVASGTTPPVVIDLEDDTWINSPPSRSQNAQKSESKVEKPRPQHCIQGPPRSFAASSSAGSSASASCTACSSITTPAAITCAVCANVLDPKSYSGAWKCRSGGEYWNSPDCGRCGVCGEAR
ncbi:WLM domain-containing protein [Kalaharituber pfeilii]|nr:WLM domain-containing protein [Kalaharituber pfeilii]